MGAAAADGAHVRFTRMYDNVVSPQDYLHDLQAGTLPSVSWLTPPFALSDHPPTSLCEGENWTVEYLNALMQSKYWKSTAVVLTSALPSSGADGAEEIGEDMRWSAACPREPAS